MDKRVLIECLKKNPKVNGSILYFLKHYEVDDWKIIGDNVLMRGKSDKEWVFISVINESGFSQLLPFITPADKNFSLIEPYMLPYLATTDDITMRLDCVRVILTDEVEMRYKALVNDLSMKAYISYFKLGDKYSIRSLNHEDVDFVFNNYDYKAFTDRAYIRERINSDISIGLLYLDELVAWGMIHDEGSIGVLHVMPEHRRQGLGKFVSMCLTLEKVRKGEASFMHIEPTNAPSLKMAQSIGYKIDRRILWISRK